MNYGRHALVALPELSPSAAATAPSLGRWSRRATGSFPKPADLGMILADMLGATRIRAVPEFEAVRRLGRFHPAAAALSSLAFACAVLALATRRFAPGGLTEDLSVRLAEHHRLRLDRYRRPHVEQLRDDRVNVAVWILTMIPLPNAASVHALSASPRSPASTL